MGEHLHKKKKNNNNNNNKGKLEDAGYQHFLLFLQCFLT